MIIFEVRKWAVTHGITDFSGMAQCAVTDSCMHMDCMRHKTIFKSFRKCEINNGLDSTKDFVLFKKNEILDINNSDDECGSSDYFRKFCYFV